MEAQFYIVATPIGNLKDITLHALDVLKSVDIIACEDTRTTSNLLNKYEISTKVISYHKFSEKASVEKILNYLENGKKIALVSDAGTPCICDPGKILLDELYKNDVKIEIVTGACAITSFLSALPRDEEKFAFTGFLEKTEKHQENIFQQFKNVNMVFYESPNRLLKTLENIKKFRGKDTKIAIGRELTKIHEEIVIKNVDEMIEYYKNNTLKGEIVGMIYKNSNKENRDYSEQIKKLKKLNFSNKDIQKILCELFEINKNEIYDLIKNIN